MFSDLVRGFVDFTIKLLRVFVTFYHFHPSPIFAVKGRLIALRDSTRVGYSLAPVEVTDSNKRSSLLRYGFITSVKGL